MTSETHHFSDVDRSRCPICGTRHDLPVFNLVDLAYCPACGVPCFYNAGALAELDIARCGHCRTRFKPKDGGGLTIYQNKNDVHLPRGFFSNLGLKREGM
jgi:hypothetical protein